MAPRTFFSPVGDVLTVLARRYGLQSRLFESRLSELWPEIAGETIAMHTRPDGIRFKRLYLLVESSVWLQQLTFFKPSLLEKINAAAGKPLVTGIILRVGSVGAITDSLRESTTNCATHPSMPPDPQATALAMAYAEPITDPVLRTRLASLMSKAWTRARQPARDRSRS